MSKIKNPKEIESQFLKQKHLINKKVNTKIKQENAKYQQFNTEAKTFLKINEPTKAGNANINTLSTSINNNIINTQTLSTLNTISTPKSKQLDYKNNKKEFVQLQDQNQNFLRSYTNNILKKKTSKYVASRFQDLIDLYIVKGYKIPNLTLAHNLFTPSAMIIEDNNILKAVKNQYIGTEKLVKDGKFLNMFQKDLKNESKIIKDRANTSSYNNMNNTSSNNNNNNISSNNYIHHKKNNSLSKQNSINSYFDKIDEDMKKREITNKEKRFKEMDIKVLIENKDYLLIENSKLRNYVNNFYEESRDLMSPSEILQLREKNEACDSSEFAVNNSINNINYNNTSVGNSGFINNAVITTNTNNNNTSINNINSNATISGLKHSHRKNNSAHSNAINTSLNYNSNFNMINQVLESATKMNLTTSNFKYNSSINNNYLNTTNYTHTESGNKPMNLKTTSSAFTKYNLTTKDNTKTNFLPNKKLSKLLNNRSLNNNNNNNNTSYNNNTTAYKESNNITNYMKSTSEFTINNNINDINNINNINNISLNDIPIISHKYNKTNNEVNKLTFDESPSINQQKKKKSITESNNIKNSNNTNSNVNNNNNTSISSNNQLYSSYLNKSKNNINSNVSSKNNTKNRIIITKRGSTKEIQLTENENTIKEDTNKHSDDEVVSPLFNKKMMNYYNSNKSIYNSNRNNTNSNTKTSDINNNQNLLNRSILKGKTYINSSSNNMIGFNFNNNNTAKIDIKSNISYASIASNNYDNNKYRNSTSQVDRLKKPTLPVLNENKKNNVNVNNKKPSTNKFFYNKKKFDSIEEDNSSNNNNLNNQDSSNRGNSNNPQYVEISSIISNVNLSNKDKEQLLSSKLINANDVNKSNVNNAHINEYLLKNLNAGNNEAVLSFCLNWNTTNLKKLNSHIIYNKNNNKSNTINSNNTLLNSKNIITIESNNKLSNNTTKKLAIDENNNLNIETKNNNNNNNIDTLTNNYSVYNFSIENKTSNNVLNTLTSNYNNITYSSLNNSIKNNNNVKNKNLNNTFNNNRNIFRNLTNSSNNNSNKDTIYVPQIPQIRESQNYSNLKKSFATRMKVKSKLNISLKLTKTNDKNSHKKININNNSNDNSGNNNNYSNLENIYKEISVSKGNNNNEIIIKILKYFQKNFPNKFLELIQPKNNIDTFEIISHVKDTQNVVNKFDFEEVYKKYSEKVGYIDLDPNLTREIKYVYNYITYYYLYYLLFNFVFLLFIRKNDDLLKILDFKILRNIIHGDKFI